MLPGLYLVVGNIFPEIIKIPAVRQIRLYDTQGKIRLRHNHIPYFLLCGFPCIVAHIKIKNIPQSLPLRELSAFLLLTDKRAVDFQKQLHADNHIRKPSLKNKRNKTAQLRIQKAKKLPVFLSEKLCADARVPIAFPVIFGKNILIQPVISLFQLLHRTFFKATVHDKGIILHYQFQKTRCLHKKFLKFRPQTGFTLYLLNSVLCK